MIESHYVFIRYFTIGNLFIWGFCDVYVAQFKTQTQLENYSLSNYFFYL